MERLIGREVINPHAIGNKVNEIVDVLNELAESNVEQSPSEPSKENGESIKKEESVTP